MKIKNTFKFLIDKYNFKYGFNIFSSYYNFLGPFYTYSFYNDCGCFTILHAVQRNEIEYYVSKGFSNKQEILFEVKVSEQIFNILKRLRRHPLNWFKADATLVAEYIADEINKKNEFLGINVKRKNN
ncbi:MAG: hypothetical protein J6B04_02850 [Clostridia bacterium]|nr:hypothetical protein [Clostridia bacterium]